MLTDKVIIVDSLNNFDHKSAKLFKKAPEVQFTEAL
jgi:hypothetical protein